MSAARQHTDGVKATGETTQIIKPMGRAEEALRKTGHQSPNCRPISNEDWIELESQLAYLRGESPVCYKCEGPLLPGQPEGAHCKSCAMSRYLEAVEEYNRLAELRGTFRHRVAVFFANIWNKFWNIIFFVFSVGLTLALCLALTPKASGVEVPDWAIKGIAAVETGADYRGIGDVRGSFVRGKIGEVSPWQLSPAVLRDLGAYDRRARVHSDVVFAESLTRAWLIRLHRVTGSWSEAVAAYHSGLGKRKQAFAIDYADRVRSAGSN